MRDSVSLVEWYYERLMSEIQFQLIMLNKGDIDRADFCNAVLAESLSRPQKHKNNRTRNKTTHMTRRQSNARIKSSCATQKGTAPADTPKV